MNVWWKLGLTIGWTLFSFATGCYVTTKFDEAAQLTAVKAQHDADLMALQSANDQAADAERLSQDRQKQPETTQKTEATLANVPDCAVPDDAIRVLNAAISPYHSSR